MFSLALKNAILLILIILILHILLKNYLIIFSSKNHLPQLNHISPLEEYVHVTTETEEESHHNIQKEEISKDEKELYSFLFHQQAQAQPKAQPQSEHGDLLLSMELGTLSKFSEYAMI